MCRLDKSKKGAQSAKKDEMEIAGQEKEKEIYTGSGFITSAHNPTATSAVLLYLSHSITTAHAYAFKHFTHVYIEREIKQQLISD